MIREPLLFLTGPTATGKSAIALEAAERLGASILSADSQQVYRGMEIGTAQPTAADRARVRHHLAGHADPSEDYQVARFVREAEAVLAEEGAAGRPVVVCGGTGLFLKHLAQGLFKGPPAVPEIRARLEEELARDGLDALRARLRAVDPVREVQINANDAMRVMRALEVYEATGVPMSEHHRRDAERRRPRRAIHVVLDRPVRELDERIARRVDAQIEAGWLDEARALLDAGHPPALRAFKAHGYRELFRVLDGAMGMDEAKEAIARQVRAYSRRQRTWHRGVSDAQWVEWGSGDSVEVVADRVEALFRERRSGG